ncbi:hypothetical protein [Priestia megaterium]|uniref:hypothetical protein n=1 Tax=Priestia megaterium TaxID=1404 RepID=UPI003EEEC5D6
MRLAYRISGLNQPLERLDSVAIQAFKETVFAYKKKRIKNTFTAYFYGTLRSLFAVERRREVQQTSNSALFYNFLEA